VQTLLFLYDTEPGDEQGIRSVHKAFPVSALSDRSGIAHIAVFLGSGRYALQVTLEDGDVQERVRQFIDHPEIQRFFDRLRSYVPGLPLPGAETAEMPIAAPMLVWSASDAAESIAI
jgi:hypothetical protein